LLRSRLEIGLESLYRLPVAKGIYLSFTPKSLYRLPVAKGIYLSFTPKSLYRLPVAKGIYLSFTPKSLRSTSYHAGLSLIHTPRVCGGPPTTQVYLSFTPLFTQLAIRSTHGANRQGPLLQEGALVPLFTPRQTGKKLVSTPFEDKYIQTKTNKTQRVAFSFNNLTIYSQTARSPPPIVQFNSFTLGSPCWQALASFQFKVEVLRKTESRKPPYGLGPDD